MEHTELAQSAADAAPAQPSGRLARLMEAWFGRSAAQPEPAPFRDSDFEADSGFFGRPLGEH